MKLLDPIAKLSARMRQTCPGLKPWEPEDLVQEVVTKALDRLERYGGTNGASLKTWLLTVGRNHLCTLATKRADPTGLQPDWAHSRPVGSSAPRDPVGYLALREEAAALMDYLKGPVGRKAVPWGCQALDILLRSAANFEYTAAALIALSGKVWTVKMVLSLVDDMRRTAFGAELCSALGLTDTNEEGAKK